MLEGKKVETWLGRRGGAPGAFWSGISARVGKHNNWGCQTMGWNYFRKEPDGFTLKRLPAITKPVRIKDVTDISDYRADFSGLTFEKGVTLYQSFFDSPDSYEIEIGSFDEEADRAPSSLLLEMTPFKGCMAEVDWLLGSSEPVGLSLSEISLKKARDAGLIVADSEAGYHAGPSLPAALMGLVQRMMSGTREAINGLPEAYQEAVWRELAMWDGLPHQLSRMAVGAYGGHVGQRVAESEQVKADEYVPGGEYGPPHFDPPIELHFRYQGIKDSYPKQRRVAVHHIVGVHQVYLKGRCLESNGERSFLGHRIDGEILNTQTGELIPLNAETTSQHLREMLYARRITNNPSGVAPKFQHVPDSPPFSSGKAKKSGLPWYRRPGVWLWTVVILWWFVLR